jgi:hypothetical protein
MMMIISEPDVLSFRHCPSFWKLLAKLVFKFVDHPTVLHPAYMYQTAHKASAKCPALKKNRRLPEKQLGRRVGSGLLTCGPWD